VGWAPYVLDLNGNGKLDEFTQPGKPEAGKDMRFNPGSGGYAVMPHPTDGSIWYTSGVFGGRSGFARAVGVVVVIGYVRDAIQQVNPVRRLRQLQTHARGEVMPETLRRAVARPMRKVDPPGRRPVHADARLGVQVVIPVQVAQAGHEGKVSVVWREFLLSDGWQGQPQ
jgi:hypothetical protein